MKILILCNSLVGLLCFRKELLEKLKENNEVVVVAPENGWSNKLTAIGVSYIPIYIERRGTNPLKDLSFFKNVKSILKDQNPEIVLTYTIKPNIYGGLACAQLKIPYIATVTGLGTSVEQKGLLQMITLPLYKMGLKKAKCVFFQNKDNLDFMINKNIIKVDKTKLVPGSGVNLEHHTLLPYPKDDTIRFLFISRILYEKGIDEYLETAKYIKSKYNSIEFHILGACDDEKYKSKLDELQNNGTIIYHGQVDDVREYHRISNCTIHPSFYPEGMSNVLLESCAAGRPIITTNRPGCKEIVEDGINGYLIECKDTNALKEKVEQFINLTNEEKKQMGLNGRKKVEREFERNIVIDQYLKCIKGD